MASDYASAMTGVIANVTCGYIVDQSILERKANRQSV
jgi:hypothetical protein